MYNIEMRYRHTKKCKISPLITCFSSPSQIELLKSEDKENFRPTITSAPNLSHIKQPRFWLASLTSTELSIQNVLGEQLQSISYLNQSQGSCRFCLRE